MSIGLGKPGRLPPAGDDVAHLGGGDDVAAVAGDVGRPVALGQHAVYRRFDRRSLRAAGIEENPSSQRAGGEWVRGQSRYRNRIGSAAHPAETGRYHLYGSNNCPWCHRTFLTRKLKGLEAAVSLDVVYYRRNADRGWQFKPDVEGCTADTVNGTQYIVELYERLGSKERSIPILWDKQSSTIVSNESAEIIRMLRAAGGKKASELQ